MSTSYEVSYVGDGTTTDFAVVPDYIRKSHIFVELNGVPTTAYTYFNDQTIRFNVAPGVGVAIYIVRRPPSDFPLNTFTGTVITPLALNENFSQAVQLTQTSLDDAATALGISQQALALASQGAAVTPAANVAAIPGSPADGEIVEVTDSTGIEGFTPMTGLPMGFVGSPGLRVRLQYDDTLSTWIWLQSIVADPDARFAKRTEISIKDFDHLATDTLRLQAAVDAAVALNEPALVKLESGKAYALGSTISVSGNKVVIDLNQSLLIRTSNYGNTFSFGYDIPGLNTYRDTFACSGIKNGRIQATADTMTSGWHISFRQTWMPYVSDLIIINGNSGIEVRSCAELRANNIYIAIRDRAGLPANRFGILIGAVSNGEYSGANHYISNLNLWGSRPSLNPFPGASLSVGLRVIGCDGLWVTQAHIAGTQDANYQLLSQFGDFIGNVSFVNCMSDKCVGTGLTISAANGTITSVFWNGWISGGGRRTVNEKTVTVIKGASNTADILPDDSVTFVRSATQGGTTYVQGVDYDFTSNSIDWSLGGSEPAEGSSYSVTYNFSGASFEIINVGRGVNITAAGTTVAGSWPISDIQISGVIGGHTLDAIRLNALRTSNIQFSNLNINTNTERGQVNGGILIERGRDVLIDNYTINGQDNAAYGIRIRTDPASGAEAIGVVDNVTIGTGRVKNCNWYRDTLAGVPGIGVQVTGTPTNVVIDGCNARNNPTNLIARASAGNLFPTQVTNSPDLDPLRYTETWTPGSIPANDSVFVSISAPGVLTKDFIERLSFSEAIADALIPSAQARPDSIRVRLRNATASPVNPGTFTVTAEVRRNY
jgi:hypothetical protein